MLLKTYPDTAAVPDFPLPSHTDFDLRQRILKILAGQHRFSLRGLDVAVQEGVVTIRGAVATFHEKQITAHRVLHVAGVIRLVDEVIVQSPIHKPSTDGSMAGLQDSS